MGLLRKSDDISGTRYQMRERVFAIGDDFWVETGGGHRRNAPRRRQGGISWWFVYEYSIYGNRR